MQMQCWAVILQSIRVYWMQAATFQMVHLSHGHRLDLPIQRHILEHSTAEDIRSTGFISVKTEHNHYKESCIWDCLDCWKMQRLRM